MKAFSEGGAGVAYRRPATEFVFFLFFFVRLAIYEVTATVVGLVQQEEAQQTQENLLNETPPGVKSHQRLKVKIETFAARFTHTQSAIHPTTGSLCRRHFQQIKV